MTALAHRYFPRGGCRTLFALRDAEVLSSGPAGTGKSRACLEKLHACMLANPGARALIVRKTAESLTTTALVTWRQHVVPEALTAGLVTFYGGSAEEPAQYRYGTGSRVMIGGMNKPSRIMSTEYDMIYVQEAVELTPDDWEALTTRLRNGVMSFQQLIADTNPDRPTHWLAERCSSGATVQVESRHTDNPRIYDDVTDLPPAPGDVESHERRYRLSEFGAAYMARLDSLTGVRRLRLRDGKWVAAEGIIYEEYDPAVHLIPPFPIPADWARYWSVDFGYRHPFVLQMWAEGPDGDLYRYRELFGTQRTVDEWATAALEQVAERAGPGWRWTEPRPAAIICDHDAENRATFERCVGQSTRAADKRVNAGIDAVKVRLRDRRLYLFRGARVHADPDLLEAHRPSCTEEEISGYVWDARRESPVKEMDDGCDALRYMVTYRDLGGRSSIRF